MIRFALLLMVSFAFAQTSVLESDGALLHFKEFGTGKPLLIINGGPGMDSNGFEPLAKILAKDFRVILYDQRGTGKSILTQQRLITIGLMTQDIEALRKHLNIEKWSVLGHSFGGMLAAHYATKHPDAISALVFSSSGGIDFGLLNGLDSRIRQKLTPSQRDSLDFYNSRIGRGDTTFEARRGRAEAIANAYIYNKIHQPIIAKRLMQTNNSVNRAVWQDLRRMNFDCSKGLESFKKPVLIIHGKDDILDRSVALRIKKALPQSELHELDRCGHYGWLDRPDVYLPEITRFLKSV